MGPFFGKFPYYSHTTPIRIPEDMGRGWETYHKGVPLLGVPGITLDEKIGTMLCFTFLATCLVSAWL